MTKHQRSGRRTALLLAAAVVLVPALLRTGPATAAPGSTSAQKPSFPAECPWMDPTKSPDQRARKLLAASSLDQKLRWLHEVSANNPEQTSFPAGAGATVTFPVQVPCTPTMVYTDGPFGVSGPTGVTAFPVPISQAASFDPSASFHKGQAVSSEAFRQRRSSVLAPGIASGRTPLSGRNSEYLGEDPVLSGVLAGAGIRGLQQRDDTPSAAVLKHFVANEQEIDRQTSSSNLDERTLQEIYALPFGIAIEAGDPAGIMCSYNQVNQVPACGNQHLLTDVLRRQQGFGGYVVTDFGAAHSLTATPPSLVAGLDQELNRPRFWTPDGIKAAIAAGTVSEADVDRAAFRVVRAAIAAGSFDHRLPATAEADSRTPQSLALATDLAVRGSVLLKNRAGLLPLHGKGLRIAVIGPTASATATNGISASTVCSGQFQGRPSVSCPQPAAALEAITARAARIGGTVSFADGSDLVAARAAAAAADVAVVFGYYASGEFSDIPDLSLDGNGDALIEAVSAANANTAVVLQTGGPVVMPWLSKVKSVLEIWYAGVNQGPAVAQLLFGDANPSGKLPQTFPRSLADTPTAGSTRQYPGVFADGSTTRPPGSTEIRQVDYSERLGVGYRWYDAQRIEPLFPFGYGLSYTEFGYSDLKLRDRGGKVDLTFRLRNTGRVRGTETPQVYLSFPNGTGEPPRRLVGFQKVMLRPGEQRTVSLSLDRASAQHLFDIFDQSRSRWRSPAGSYTVQVGSSSRDLRLEARIALR